MTGPGTAQSNVPVKFVAALAIFVLISGGCFGYLQPDLDNIRQMTAAANDAAISLQVNINDLGAREARDTVDRNKFAGLEKTGFMGPQNRLHAARILEALRVKHRISGLEYQIDPVEVTSVVKQPANTTERISVSKISMSMRGFRDSDLHKFTAAVKSGLPGYVTVTEVEMEKLLSPDNALLLQIRNGGGRELVRGSVQLLWQAVHLSPQDDGL